MELQLSATWVLEVVACVLSVGFLAAMAGVLGHANGQVVLSWHGLTLNTIISILGTASKLCAMFVLGAAIAQSKWAIFSHSPRSLLEFEAVEQAGRGAFGAAKLLCTTRKVATVGAVAILLSLAFDPFEQQIVQFDQDMEWANSSAATLPRTQRFSAGNRIQTAHVAIDTGNLTRGSGEPGGVFVDTDFSIQSSVLYGLSHSTENVTQQLPALCPSGNCTWATSESLAVCSTCKDVSSFVRKNLTDTFASQFTFMALDLANMPQWNGNYTQLLLPNGLILDNMEGSAPYLLMTTFGTGDVAKTVSMSDLDTMIWSTTILRLSESQRIENWPPTAPPEALEYALHYCVNRYNVNVTNSTITQSTQVNAAAVRDPRSWQPSMPGVRYLNMSKSSRASLEFDSKVSAVTRTDLMLGDGYNISQKAVDSVSDYFQRTFADNRTSHELKGINGYFMGGQGQSQYAPSAIQPLLNSTNLPSTFAALAESLSNAIRAGGDGKIRQIGRVGTPVTRYRISWPWITLPAIVVLFALLQLVITMWTSRHTPLWKSSTLATLSRGAYIGNVLEEASTVQEMHVAAGSQPVHLFSHTAPGGIAVVANSNMAKKDLARVSVAELNDVSSASSPIDMSYGQARQVNEAQDYIQARHG